MIGYETERRLKNFLVAIGDGELLLEKARQRLCEIRDFSPESAFQRIDRDGNIYVSSFELLNFLRDNNIFTVSESECYRLVKFFDSDEDGRLSLSDFSQLVLPCEDNLLRRITQERPAFRVGRYDYLPRDIELALTDLLEKELDLHRRQEILKQDMEVRYDYTTYAAFRAIDKYNEGNINTYNLSVFLKNNGYFATERELLAIIRRIDTDGDAKLSYSEFADFLRSSENRVLEELKRSYSAEKQARNLQASSSYGSPLKNQSTYQSPTRSHSAYGRRTVTINTPLRESQTNFRASPLKESSILRASSPIRKQPLLRLEEEDELVRALREQISLEKELENAKIVLAQRHDFNLYDAFRIFDIDAKGYVTYTDLKSGLNDIGLFPSVEELELFIKRYDKNNDHRLRFSEFCDSLTPLDAYYGSLVNKRVSNDTRGRLYQRDDCFLSETKIEFRNVWRTHFKIESYSESLRQRLYKRPGFNLYEAFISCDLNDDGTISREELRRLIESRGFYVSDKEVNQLVEKIDKDRDGRISYAETKSLMRYKIFRTDYYQIDAHTFYYKNMYLSFYSSEKNSNPEAQLDTEQIFSPLEIYEKQDFKEVNDAVFIPECKVFRPKKEEFKDFQSYLEKCDKEAGSQAIFKVIPPPGWVARKEGYENLNFTVKKPIEQNVHGNKGIYELVYFMKESKSLSRFKKQSEEFDKLINGKTDEEIERLFWRTLKLSAPVYGADVPQSLFDKGIPWNLAEIDSILTKGLGDQKISGVNTPYVYVGSWKTMFGWHKEDMDLYSINYLHYGKPKFWYGINIEDNEKFEQFVKTKFPEYFKECPEFIRHKTTLIHPSILLANGIRMNKMTHRKGEFMISRAQGYHSGFNHGFNIAEAVNFALRNWLKVASNVSACKCVKDSVHFNMGSFYQNMRLNILDKETMAASAANNNSNSKIRQKYVDFDTNNLKSHYTYSFSENLHSYKNTPLNIKISPNRTPQKSFSYSNLPISIKNDNNIHNLLNNQIQSQQTNNSHKRVMICVKCNRARKVPMCKPNIQEANFECKQLKNSIIICDGDQNQEPLNKKEKQKQQQSVSKNFKKREQKNLSKKKQKQNIAFKKSKQENNNTNSNEIQSNQKDIRMKKRRGGQPSTPRQKIITLGSQSQRKQSRKQRK